MFTRSTTDNRRVRIVDYAHMAWSYVHGAAKPLSVTRKVNGVVQVIDTTIPAYTIKALNRIAKNGAYPLAVCFDSRGCSDSRKVYFAQAVSQEEVMQGKGYKARREPPESSFFTGVNMTMELLHEAGITVLKAAHYEADDLVKACVDSAKRTYPDLPIDVITGDHDLVPLVDEQVSVYLRSTKTTWAESKDIEIPHYVQITPENYSIPLENLSCYKTSKLQIPYNTVLLAKLLRGDKSDDIQGKADWKPKMYNKLIDILNANNELGIFRYGTPKRIIYHKATGAVIAESEVKSYPREQLAVRYEEPEELTKICEVLSKYCEPADIEHVKFIYNGINLNGAFQNLPDGYNRAPARLASPISGYSVMKLHDICSKQLDIQIIK